MADTRAATLPEHPEDLRQFCVQLLAELQDQTQLIAELTHELALFRRYLCGRRSETLDPGQLLLEFTSWLKAPNETAPADVPVTPTSSAAPPAAGPRAGHGRQRLPALLPRGASSMCCRTPSAPVRPAARGWSGSAKRPASRSTTNRPRCS